MRFRSGTAGAAAVALACMAWTVTAAQTPVNPQLVEIPRTATTLEGVPTVRIDSTEKGATRRVLTDAEAKQNKLSVRIANGEFFWTSRDNRPLRLDSTDGFIYLQDKPGSYIKFTKLDDNRITYVEHVDHGLESITYWGELRIVLGK
jgi:hypothetical protein